MVFPQASLAASVIVKDFAFRRFRLPGIGRFPAGGCSVAAAEKRRKCDFLDSRAKCKKVFPALFLEDFIGCTVAEAFSWSVV